MATGGDPARLSGDEEADGDQGILFLETVSREPGDDGASRDTAVDSAALVAGTEKPSPFSVVVQRLGGSAEAALPLEHSSTVKTPSPLDESAQGGRRAQDDEDVLSACSENHALKQRVKDLEKENEQLRENLRLREREVKVKEKEAAVELKRQESEVDIQQKQLQLDMDRLQLEREQHAFKEQQREDYYRAKEQELEVKDRELRAKALELQTEREQHQLEVKIFELQQRKQREYELLRESQLQTVMKENAELRKKAERLESENSQLKEKVGLLESEVDYYIAKEDEIQPDSTSMELTSELDVHVPTVEGVGSVPGISNMISLSKVVGSCGKQCIVCGKEENRCTQCGHQRAEHCASKEPCECLKQHHAFDRQCLRDSHAYSKGMLLRVCGKKDEEVIWDATKGPKVASRKPSTCCWNLLCKQCEQTTSTIEEHVCRRHDREYYKSLDEGSIHPGDIIVFSAFTYRAMPVNTNIFRFLLDPSHKQSQATGRVLRTLHQAFSDAQEHDSESLPVKSCEKKMLFVYHDSRDDHNIEFPFLCEADLSAAGLGCHWLVYGQMPPYYWAFPLEFDDAVALQPHFRSIVRSVNSQLEQDRDQYYQMCSEAEQKRGTIKLVIGYLRKLMKCYVRVSVNPQ